MKKMLKTMITSLVLLLAFTADAHTLTRKGWCSNRYHIDATIGSPNGKIEVTVYTNSGMGTIIPQLGGISPNYTITYTLDASGKSSFTVPQININTTVYVRVKWFKPSGSGYVLDNWNGSGINAITTNNSLLPGCTTLAIKTLEIVDAKNVNNTTIIHFKAESDTDNETLTINYIMPDQTLKSIKIVFWTMLKPEDTWEVIIDNLTNNKVISVKNKK